MQPSDFQNFGPFSKNSRLIIKFKLNMFKYTLNRAVYFPGCRGGNKVEPARKTGGMFRDKVPRTENYK